MTQALDGDPLLTQLSEFLVGLANMLKVVVEMLYEYGAALIERANLSAPAAGGAK